MTALIILSKEQRVIDLLREAINTRESPGNVEVIETDEKLLERLQEPDKAAPTAVFVDLDGFPDGARLVEWLKLSPSTRRFKVVAIGEESEAMAGFRNAWGGGAALRKPLSVDAVQKVVAEADQGPQEPGESSRHAARKRLVEAIEEAKRLRKEQQTLVRHADALIAEIKDRKIPRKRDRPAGRTEAINLCPPGVLYIADNPADRHLFSTAMSQSLATFSVQFLHKFSDVLDHLREKGETRRLTSDRPCCLLLDSAAVGEPTCEVLRWIRHQSGFPELLLVVISETDNPETVRAVYGAGADYYLVRPQSFEGIIAIVNAIELGLRQAPPRFHGFIRLPEYRDAIGNSATSGATGAQCTG
jgi:CheY-like chemotaxis protein